MVFFYLLFAGFWEYLYKYFKYNSERQNNFQYYSQYKKISRNLISLIHSISVVLLNISDTLPQFFICSTRYISLSYFLYDLIHTLINVKNFKNPMNLGFIFHHIICIGALQYYDIEPYQTHFVNIFLYSEMSNILMYIVYHFLKVLENKNHPIIITLQFIQTIIYIYIRGFLLFKFGFYLTTDPNVSNYVHSLWIVYVIGLIWGYKLVLQSINNVKYIRKNIRSVCRRSIFVKKEN